MRVCEQNDVNLQRSLDKKQSIKIKVKQNDTTQNQIYQNAWFR